MNEIKELLNTDESKSEDRIAKNKFQTLGRACVANFIGKTEEEKTLLHDVYNYLINKPLSEWQVSVYPYSKYPNTYTFSNLDSNELEEAKKSAESTRCKGNFSYYFYRLDYHGNDPNHCPLCKLVNNYILHETCLKRMNQLTGEIYTKAVSIFASCYTGGCFLTTHTDTGRGRLAWALNLTKEYNSTFVVETAMENGWKEEYGGCLEFLEWDYKTKKEIILPEFNNFTFFNVENQGTPHAVSKVSPPNFQGKRLSLTGWFY